MSDSSKTKVQLLEELQLLREHVSTLESTERDYRLVAEAQRRAQLAELDALYRTAPVGLCLLDRDLRFVRINERLAAINGLPPEAHIGRTVEDVIPEVARTVAPIYRKVVETGEPVIDLEIHGSTPAQPDTERHWRVSCVPLKVSGGRVHGANIVVADVTEQSLAVRALEIYKRIVAASPDHMSFVDSNYVYREANDAYLAAFGRTREQIVGHTVSELFGQEIFETTVRPRLDRCLSGKQIQYQSSFYFSGIGERLMDVSYAPLRDEKGAVVGAMVAARDITERARAKEDLRTAHDRLETTLSALPDLLFEISPEGRFLDCRAPHPEKLYAPVEGFLGKTIPEVLPEPVAGVMLAAIREALETERSEGTQYVLEVGGQKRRFELSVARSRAHAVAEPRLVALVRDITERKTAEAERRAEGARAQAYLDLAGVLFIAIDTEGRVTLANRKACELLGYPEAEIIGKNWFDTFLPKHMQDAVRTVSLQLLRGDLEPMEHYENPVLTKGGEERLIAWDNTILRDQKGAIVGHLSSGEDITERKRVDEELRESMLRSRALLDQTSQFIGLLTKEGVMIGANRASLESFGLESSNVVGKPFWETPWWTHSREQQEHLREGIQRAAAGEFVRFEASHPGPDGTTRYIDGSLKPVRDENGDVCLLIPEGHDITDRKRADAALRESEERFRTIAENIPGVVCCYEIDADDHRTLQYIGPGLEDLLGEQAQRVLDAGMDHYFSLIHADDKDGLQKASTVAAAAGTVLDHEYRLSVGGDDHRWVRAIFRPIPVTHGVTRWLGVLIDNTERKRVQEALQKSEERYRAIAEETPVLICGFRPDGEITYANDAYCKYFNTTRSALVGTSFLLRIPESDRETVIANISALTVDTPAQSHEHRVIAPSGAVRWHRWTNRALFDSGGTPVAFQAIGEDISTRKNAESELRKARRELEARVRERTEALRLANEHLQSEMVERTIAEEQVSKQRAELAHLARLDIAGEMVSGITHELGQPLAVVLNGAEACARLLREGTDDTAALIAALERIASQAERAGSVINSFKRFIRRQAPKSSPIDINFLIRDAVELARPEAIELGATIELKLAERLPKPAGDEVQITQVLLNLIRNALDAVRECVPAARRLVISTGCLNGAGLEVSVRHFGIGQGTKPVEQMFVPFYSTKPDGMGIGLSLSRSIVEAHRGRLSATPNSDRGMTFVLTLPTDR